MCKNENKDWQNQAIKSLQDVKEDYAKKKAEIKFYADADEAEQKEIRENYEEWKRMSIEKVPINGASVQALCFASICDFLRSFEGVEVTDQKREAIKNHVEDNFERVWEKVQSVQHDPRFAEQSFEEYVAERDEDIKRQLATIDELIPLAEEIDELIKNDASSEEIMPKVMRALMMCD